MVKKKLHGEYTKSSSKNPLFFTASFIIFILILLPLAGCSDGETNEAAIASSSENAEIHGDGIVSSGEKYANVGMVEQLIKEYDRIDNFESDWMNAEVTESPKDRVNKETGDTYQNIYIVEMDYTWQDKIYNVRSTISWDTPQADGTAHILSYSNSTGTENRIDTDYTE